MQEREKILLRKNKNELPAVRTLEVFLDRADNVIEGGAPGALRAGAGIEAGWRDELAATKSGVLAFARWPG
jgi:hypothetical protein